MGRERAAGAAGRCRGCGAPADQVGGGGGDEKAAELKLDPEPERDKLVEKILAA